MALPPLVEKMYFYHLPPCVILGNPHELAFEDELRLKSIFVNMVFDLNFCKPISQTLFSLPAVLRWFSFAQLNPYSNSRFFSYLLSQMSH